MENKKFYCGNCGKEIDANVSVCPYCDAEFDEDSTSEEIKAIAKPALTFDKKVEKTVLGLEKVADVIKVLSIIGAIFVFVGGIIVAADSEYDSGGIFIGYLIITIVLAFNAYISYLIFNWLSHTLNCLFQLTRKKK